MKYEDFEKFIQEKCMYETMYYDSDGRQILVIKVLDAYGMVNKAQREWQGLTDEEKVEIQMLKWWDWEDTFDLDGYTRAIEAKLKEKNA
jgi:hypothetical protein